MESVYGSYVRQKPDLQASGMRNLIMAEKEISETYESVARFEELLYGIKKHIKEAINHYMATPNISKELIDVLKETKAQVSWAVSSEELILIIFKIMDLRILTPLSMKG
ncbi:MAG: hypothetical protein H7X84_01515 [Verrucomicrobia bacterium]|nr:hypothetical protein [Prolixibacteraceae bacterium]